MIITVTINKYGFSTLPTLKTKIILYAINPELSLNKGLERSSLDVTGDQSGKFKI